MPYLIWQGAIAYLTTKLEGLYCERPSKSYSAVEHDELRHKIYLGIYFCKNLVLIISYKLGTSSWALNKSIFQKLYKNFTNSHSCSLSMAV